MLVFPVTHIYLRLSVFDYGKWRLIATFRNQIQKVVNKYESQEKPTLERDYSLLLESIQSLLGVTYSQHPNDKRLAKMDERIEQLVESLENYGLKIVSFSEDKICWFEQQESTKVTKPTMIYPAIIKNGILVKRGKVFVQSYSANNGKI